ncbi:MAG: helix-turn-helix domain-containing protein [Clostridia bacterium]
MPTSSLRKKLALYPSTAHNLSNLKTGKVRAIRFSTLEAICRVLECQPGDILEYKEEQDSTD